MPPETQLPDVLLRLPIAHRGLHAPGARRPENGTSAFAAAIAHGYGIELDVQMSADRQAVVFHDARLERMTDAAGPVVARTAAELSALLLRDSDDTIATLAQVCAQIAGRVPLLVELKDQHGALGDDDGHLESAVADALRGYAGPVAVMSFNPHMVIRLRALLPQVPRGLVTCAFDADDWSQVPEARRARLRDIADLEASGAAFISHQASDLEAAPVAACARAGVAILCWTIRSPDQEAQARRLAQNITFEGYLPALPDRSA